MLIYLVLIEITPVRSTCSSARSKRTLFMRSLRIQQLRQTQRQDRPQPSSRRELSTESWELENENSLSKPTSTIAIAAYSYLNKCLLKTKTDTKSTHSSFTPYHFRAPIQPTQPLAFHISSSSPLHNSLSHYYLLNY